MMSVVEASVLGEASEVAIAVALYAAVYLSFVRVLKFPRNWVPLIVADVVPTVGLTLAMLAHVSRSSDGFDGLALVFLAGFVTVLFYIIAAPAIAFGRTSRPIEYLARRGDYAGLGMIVPAVVFAFAIPNPKLQGVLVAATVIELAWTLRRRWTDRRAHRLYPIEGRDLEVLKIQANRDLDGFAERHGIRELVQSDDAVGWRGCSKATDPCPFNLYVNRLGLNAAPCCRERLTELCNDVGTWLDELGVVNWLEGGTLLGAVRENGTLLAWEDDIDVSILIDNDEDWDALAAEMVARGARYGYFVDEFRRKQLLAITHAAPIRGPLRWENYRLRGEIRLDLTAYRSAVSRGEPVLERRGPKGNMPRTENGAFGIARDLVLPTSTIPFLGRDAGCPNRSKDYLRVLYGDFEHVSYAYVDAGPAAARSHLDV